MAFLEDNCILDILSDGILEECHPFVCGDDDMDEFFHKDVLDYTRYRMGKSYPGVLIGRLAVSSLFAGKGVGSEILDFIRMWFLDESNKTGCRFAIVDAKNEPKILRFYERKGFKSLFPREIDEDFYTKPPKDEDEKTERLKNPRKLRTRLMFCDLLEE